MSENKKVQPETVDAQSAKAEADNELGTENIHATGTKTGGELSTENIHATTEPAR